MEIFPFGCSRYLGIYLPKSLVAFYRKRHRKSTGRVDKISTGFIVIIPTKSLKHYLILIKFGIIWLVAGPKQDSKILGNNIPTKQRLSTTWASILEILETMLRWKLLVLINNMYIILTKKLIRFVLYSDLKQQKFQWSLI